MKNYLKKINLFTLIMSTVFMLSGCNSKSKEVEFLKPHLDKKVSVLSDSSFFGNYTDAIYMDDHLLITDAKNNRIVTCDTAFNLISGIGRAGNGPGEISNPLRCSIKKNLIYVFDNGNKALSLFTKDGKFVKRITYRTSFIPARRFAIDDSSKIFICARDFDSPIATLDTSGNIVRQFGTFFPSKSIKEQRVRSDKHIFLLNDDLVCVGVSEPTIEIYTKRGRELREFNLSQDAYIKKSVENIESERQKDPNSRENATYRLFGDAYLAGNHLYLLLSASDKMEMIPDKIIVYSIGTTLEFYKALDLREGQEVLWYTTFAVSADEKRIFAYVANRSEWRVFSIPESPQEPN